ncbi:MAG: hypothetical protein O2822_03260 [Chloroflexi bacterium]|nr:hypothetical protein [Chloroflexota bacterium]
MDPLPNTPPDETPTEAVTVFTSGIPIRMRSTSIMAVSCASREVPGGVSVFTWK